MKCRAYSDIERLQGQCLLGICLENRDQWPTQLPNLKCHHERVFNRACKACGSQAIEANHD